MQKSPPLALLGPFEITGLFILPWWWSPICSLPYAHIECFLDDLEDGHPDHHGGYWCSWARWIHYSRNFSTVPI
jgi:hypothetical protein